MLWLPILSFPWNNFFKNYLFFSFADKRFKSGVKTLLWLTTMKDKLVHQGNPEDFTWLRWVREVTEQMDAKTSKGHHQCCQLNQIWEKLEWPEVCIFSVLKRKDWVLKTQKVKLATLSRLSSTLVFFVNVYFTEMIYDFTTTILLPFPPLQQHWRYCFQNRVIPKKLSLRRWWWHSINS